MEDLNKLTELVIKEGASDLHISENRNPYIRVAGQLVPLLKYPKFTKALMEDIVKEVLSDSKKTIFKSTHSADFSYTHDGERFRAHVYLEQQKICMTFRHVPKKIQSFPELNLPSSLEYFAKLKSGFFLVTGPTGHGKSTTLASMIETINNERLENIITIEDPIEYLFTANKSVIHQREIGMDTPDFATALRNCFRADVNVIMVGEMRDADTISTAVSAAETGHLVFSTLHTNSAAQTVDRIIDSFTANQQIQIRIQLASSLSGIFSQRLIPRISGGLIPAYELLINNTAVSNLIRDKRTHELDMVIETSSQEGMIDFNKCLVERVNKGEISIENAYLYSNNPRSLEKML
ncbi:MAG: type IV pili twitching motility protein PilT [Candidatus Zambryskibacteria bacterium RIFCSPHIGHO2_12_FULL_38_34]|uniref:Type IV pili twitching motility protein PilT n=1 Tax=Candidatus Zambryskibacteria bacterium RIFCSPLOWO2_12_FULL_39_16 TaxID=1802775 RepID=A0A1G2UTW3_9BACT|nr:MAG: type IV pili twitching motility protein PilT [Candidatus Zambryskibacteria bacterium RIFCSPHIGHO2_02_FULL_38_22]OHA97552.1 MAG: type IV pili twitching motility protein PilT [Candidatus Zambryskibacteria bacterium RIFCSPHIGHO2_12_FULL_38_34]OHB08137.1 MAG: type IV pili twitching motility protein PilT [Candidatus Zambryskibacteria bacterium RIFCSPLOWO2_02_FULL_38_13]OHB12831.1 MAG: type IV pili twitching motility protein PilT [Candidatus Zambryskibacteria bacterium RIFCSPLOWO2_12_FULL_39_1